MNIFSFRKLFLSFLVTALPLNFVLAEQVIFTEIHYNPWGDSPEFLELTNNTVTPLDMGNWSFTDGISFTFPDFNPGSPDAHILKHFETILLTRGTEAELRAAYPSIPPTVRVFGPYEGALSNSGERVTLSDKNGVILTTVDYDDGGKWPATADGAGHSLVRINPDRSNAGWRNWEASELPGGTPGVTPADLDGPPTFTTQIVETDSVWKYDQNESNSNLGTAWRELAYDDSNWPEGPGLFGTDTGINFPTAWTTGGRTTYYLRHEFQFDKDFLGALADISVQLDDGAVFYLNGQEIARFNMPDGQINFDTPAVSHREWNDVTEVITGADIGSLLLTGTNVLAVEVHNRAAGSNDIAFGATVSITATEPPAIALPNLVISEVHFDNTGTIDWVELHAPGNSPISVGGMALTTSRSLINPTFINGTIPAGGYLSFPVSLPIDADGDVDLFLVLRNLTVIDAARLERKNNEEGFQSVPVGKEFYGGPGHTRDAPNNPTSRQTNIVINEVMYKTPSNQRSAEFIELFNRGQETVNLTGWKITEGVAFDFPAGTTMAPGAYLVIASDLDFLRSIYGSIPALGNFEGGIRNGGELIRIEDQAGNLVDEVDYSREGQWPTHADGWGSSMELRNPFMDNMMGTAWASSDESQKAPMQSFSYTEKFERSTWLPVTSGQELHVHLVGDSYVILENISVQLDGTGPNLLRNPDTMSPTASSASGWVTQGTHFQSFMNNGALHLIATGHGDNKANRGEVDFATPLIVGQSYTLSFDARWVRGKSRVIFQTLDHGFGHPFRLPIPENLGTPGAPNSTLIANPAPTLQNLRHNPAVPTPGQPVTVSVELDSHSALTSAELVYRLDNTNGNGTWLRAPLTPAGDGLYSASVNQFTSQGNIIQFYIEATSNNQTTTLPRSAAAKPAMWIVDGRTMPNILRRDRFIISEFDRRALTLAIGSGSAFDYNFPRMSNQFFNATFISNENEAYYNTEIRKSGSPFTRSQDANLDHGKWKLPKDQLFRGRRRHVIDASGTPEGSNTPRFYDDRIARYFLYQLGHPINEMEFTHTVINNLPFKLRENHEPISNDFIERNFEDGNQGTLLRIDDEWRYTGDDGEARSSRNADWSYKNSENPVAYHSEFLMRTREDDYDYSSFIEFTRVLHQNQTDESTLSRITEIDLLALNATVRGYNADWDTITVNRGKNAYFFRPKFGNGWMLIHWDGDRVFERTDQAILGGLPGVSKYFSRPFVRRQMNHFMNELLTKHTKNSARTLAWMQAETNAVAGSGVTMTTSHYTNWFNARETLARNFIGNALTTNFAITTPNTATSANTITLSGTAPSTILNLQVVGQTKLSPIWLTTTAWQIPDLVLKEGPNTITLQGLNVQGELIDQIQFNITKTTNAPPVIQLVANPASFHLPFGDPLLLDASSSFDPDGDSLTFNWEISPSEGVNFNQGIPAPTLNFTKPGFYLLSLNLSDPNANTVSRTFGVSVYLPNHFAKFNEPLLPSPWTLFNSPKQGNSPITPTYSLESRTGRFTINVPTGGFPLTFPEPELPPAQNYLNFTDVWKYDDSNDELTGTFAQPDFDDSAWPSGPGFFGFNETSLPAPGIQTTVRRDSAAGLLAYYFRKEFEFNGDPGGAKLYLSHIVDDGVRYYLNGQVIGSVRLPDGQIDSNTIPDSLANDQEGVIEENVIVIDVSSYLVTGTNVLAAQVHNRAAGNVDLAFGCKVDIAANPLSEGPPNLDLLTHPWIRRTLPNGDWVLKTKVKLEKEQFGNFHTGLLVQGTLNNFNLRYGLAIQNGNQLAAVLLNPFGSLENLGSIPFTDADQATIQIAKQEGKLIFSQVKNDALTTIYELSIPPGMTFDLGGFFASTESTQSLEASFDYAMMIDFNSDFSAWMLANGLSDPDAEYQNSGLSNLMAYALGRDLNPQVAPTIVTQNGQIGFSYRQRIIGGQVLYRVEKSTDLITWQPAGDLQPTGEPSSNPDSTFTVNLLSTFTQSDQTEIYYRLVVSIP